MGKTIKKFCCYFDGSYRPEISRGAFYVETNESIKYSQTVRLNAKNPHAAEMGAFLYLLLFLRDGGLVPPKSQVLIFGDMLAIVQAANSDTGKHRKKYKAVWSLYEQLKNTLSISVEHIPKSKNTKAHRLAQGQLISIAPQPKKPDSGVIKGTLLAPPKLDGAKYVGCRRTRLRDIVVPKHMSLTNPRPEKVIRNLEYFSMYGKFKDTIKIDEHNVLLDGLIALIILKDRGFSYYNTDVYKREATNLLPCKNTKGGPS